MQCAGCGQWFLRLTRSMDEPIGPNRDIRRYYCAACWIELEGDDWPEGIPDTPVLMVNEHMMLIVKNDSV